MTVGGGLKNVERFGPSKPGRRTANANFRIENFLRRCGPYGCKETDGITY